MCIFNLQNQYYCIARPALCNKKVSFWCHEKVEKWDFFAVCNQETEKIDLNKRLKRFFRRFEDSFWCWKDRRLFAPTSCPWKESRWKTWYALNIKLPSPRIVLILNVHWWSWKETWKRVLRDERGKLNVNDGCSPRFSFSLSFIHENLEIQLFLVIEHAMSGRNLISLNGLAAANCPWISSFKLLYLCGKGVVKWQNCFMFIWIA